MNALEQHLPNDLVDLVCGYAGNRGLDAFVDLMKRYRAVMSPLDPHEVMCKHATHMIAVPHVDMLREFEKTGTIKEVTYRVFPSVFAVTIQTVLRNIIRGAHVRGVESPLSFLGDGRPTKLTVPTRRRVFFMRKSYVNGEMINNLDSLMAVDYKEWGSVRRWPRWLEGCDC